MNISEHISYNESITSESAVRHGIANIPNDEQLANMKATAEKIFEPLRTYLSNNIRKKDSPIKINSFFRSVEVNKLIKGSSSSQHCEGKAMDLECNYPNFNNKDLFFLIKEKSIYDQLIWEFGDDKEPAWVHVSYNGNNNRKQVLSAIIQDGKTIYIPFK